MNSDGSNSAALYVDMNTKLVQKTRTEEVCYNRESIYSCCCCWLLDDTIYYSTRHQDFRKVPEPEPLYCCIPMCICCCYLPICSCICLPKLTHRHTVYVCTPICNFCDELLDTVLCVNNILN